MTYFLYDLLEDPYEMHDLSDKLPLKAKQMKTALLEWIEAVAKSRGPSETNCQAMLPPPSPPSPSPAAGPFTPIVTRTIVAETCAPQSSQTWSCRQAGAQNCTWVEHSTMPGSSPTRKPGVASKELCCAACFDTSWW